MKLLKMCLVMALFFTQETNAQTTLGGGLVYGNEISSAGINLTGQFFITKDIAIAPAFTYYFPSTVGFITGVKRNWYEGNLDVNYYPTIEILEGKLKTYGLAGANYSILSTNYDSVYFGTVKSKNVSKFGVNLGVGAQYDFGKNFIPFLQLKHTILPDSFSQTQVAVGIRFTF